MVRVLFVCLGNICRSPMAEAVFRHLVQQKDLSSKIDVDSAGTSDWHIGKRPHDGTLRTLAQYDIRSEGMYARQFTAADGETFDYIVAMDDSNERHILQTIEERYAHKVFKLLDLTEEERKDVPDPYYTGNFEETYALVLDGCERLLHKIVQEHHIL